MDIYTGDFTMPVDEEQREAFVIDNDTMADWALRKIAEREAEFSRLKKIAEEQMQSIQARLDYEDERCDRDNAYLTSKLAEYFRTIEGDAKDTKTQKKYKLFSGSLVLHKGKDKPTYNDEDLIAYLKTDEEKAKAFIKTKESIAWADLKKTLDFSTGKAIIADTGEVIDCITIDHTDDVFSVETN